MLPPNKLFLYYFDFDVIIFNIHFVLCTVKNVLKHENSEENRPEWHITQCPTETTNNVLE